MRNYITKTYSMVIDFLDYNGTKNVTEKIVYNQKDTNTAFISAKLVAGEDIVNLDNYDRAIVGIKKSDGYNVQNDCTIVDSKKGIIEIPFTIQSLASLGICYFDVTLYKDGAELVSPKFSYRVAEATVSNETVESLHEFGTLNLMIQQVSGVLSTNAKLVTRVENLESTVKKNEPIRQSNELIRIKQETQRQKSISDITSTFNNKVVEVNTNLTNNTKKIDDKIVDIQTQLDSKVKTKFNEVDSSLNNKLVQAQTQVDKSLETNNKKIDDKISDVNKKISEVDSAKNNMQSTVRTSLFDFEKRFNELESADASGEILQARTAIDGTTKNSLKERLTYDLNKKASTIHTHNMKDINGLSLTWDGVTGKPTSFNPSSHTHPMKDITGLSLTWSSITGKPNISSSTLSTSTTDIASSYAVKIVNDKANEALNKVDEVTSIVGKNKEKLITLSNEIVDLI